MGRRTPFKDLFDREPLTQKIQNAATDKASEIRQRPGKRIANNIPEFNHRNIGGGTFVGAVASGISVIIEDAFGIPFGASSDIVDSEIVSDGAIYTVNVNAPTINMAEARAKIDSATGFSSFITDTLDVEGVEIEKTRFLRDTLQVKVKIRD